MDAQQVKNHIQQAFAKELAKKKRFFVEGESNLLYKNDNYYVTLSSKADLRRYLTYFPPADLKALLPQLLTDLLDEDKADLGYVLTQLDPNRGRSSQELDQVLHEHGAQAAEQYTDAWEYARQAAENIYADYLPNHAKAIVEWLVVMEPWVGNFDMDAYLQALDYWTFRSQE